MQQDFAQGIGIDALGWIAGQENLLDAFLHSTGAEIAQLRQAARDPAFMAAVLDFVLQDDAWVLDCAQAIGARPEDIVTARAVLGGGDQMHWT